MMNTTRLSRLHLQAARIPRATLLAHLTAQPRRSRRVSITTYATTRHAHTASAHEPELSENIAPVVGKAGLGIDQVPLNEIKGPITPLSRYNQLVQAGALRDDAHQRTIIDKLEKMHWQLREYHPPPVPTSSASTAGSLSWFSNWFSSSTSPNHVVVPPGSVPKGMYLFGDVGCGKTMLMDLFYSTLPEHLHPQRRRIHFHAFMLDVFRRVHAIKHGLPTSAQPPQTPGELKREIKSHIPLAKERIRKQRGYDPMQGRSDERAVGVEALSGLKLFKLDELFTRRRGGGGGTVVAEEDAIYEAAREMVEEGRILCFDEFQVTDIVTAMILRQLLDRMMDYGMVCIITSK